MTDKPAVLFVCVHNAGRSQMAAGYLTELAHGAIEVRSAGSLPGDHINPVAVQAKAPPRQPPPRQPLTPKETLPTQPTAGQAGVFGRSSIRDAPNPPTRVASE
jgi:hypothetical protein